MLTGRDMSASLRNRGRYLDEDRNMADSASMCFDAATEIDRLLDVIRTRDKHIKELQAEIFVSDDSDITKLDALRASQREALKTSLTVLCAARGAHLWSRPMLKDFDLAIDGCRTSLGIFPDKEVSSD